MIPGVAAAVFVAAAAAPLAEQSFAVDRVAEVVATVHAGCERCDWGVAGREGAAVRVAVDGRYRAHVMLTRGEADAEYRVLLGRYGRGTHVVTIASDPSASARDIGAVHISRVDVAAIDARDPSFEALAHAPVLHARPNTIGRFTDVPLLMWYETAPTRRGRSYRYSVIFSNEDGGTATDRLMATWGRTTDVEFVYGVELDASGRAIAEEFQGPDHVVARFRGRHEVRHPVEFVVTDNNMVSDRPPSLKLRRAGASEVRYAPAPEPFDLTNQSREVVMDAHPWTYRVMSAEMIREGKIADDAAAGSGKIADPRQFVFVEACTELEGAALAFGVRAATADGPRWFDSHRGLNQFRIVRTGFFRGAVPIALAQALRPAVQIDAVHFRAWPQAEPKTDRPHVRVVRVNAIFMLDDHFVPQRLPFQWTGSLSLTLDGTPAELPLY